MAQIVVMADKVRGARQGGQGWSRDESPTVGRVSSLLAPGPYHSQTFFEQRGEGSQEVECQGLVVDCDGYKCVAIVVMNSYRKILHMIVF